MLIPAGLIETAAIQDAEAVVTAAEAEIAEAQAAIDAAVAQDVAESKQRDS